MARNRFSDKILKVARQQKITTQLFFRLKNGSLEALKFILGLQCPCLQV